MSGRVAWRKSSRSGGTGGDCVELAHTRSAVLVRDSKNPDGPKLVFTPAHFAGFLNALRNG
ncbi:hypothetical protein GCM10010492_01430 [Saccharothrix mutabilis subsp. mutabilis]|uniref:DUF397 domain-containing protein n=1 Tax=Saccharothrix mutabilis subsp. mutabilis TaxID=66855 RepID=A0ABP3CJJ5_9PSEU